jgi:hypothetical protein
MLRLWARIALADTLLAAGEYKNAKDLATAVLDQVSLRIPEKMRLTWVAALAAAALGDREGAARRLDEAIERTASSGVPSMRGQLHEARARIALAAGDLAGARAHLTAMAQYLLDTGNPALIRLVRRLEEEVDGYSREQRTAAVTGSASHAEAVTQSFRTARIATPAAITELVSAGSPTSRARHVLSVLVEVTEAATGWLYLRSHDGVINMLGRDQAPPPEEPAAQVPDLFNGGEPAPGQSEAWLALPLRETVNGSAHVVAVALLARGHRPLRAPDPALCGLLARTLYAGESMDRSTEIA